MAIFIIDDGISGDGKEISAPTPTKALIKYLQEEVELNLQCDSWNYDIEIRRKFPRHKYIGGKKK